jgi:peptidoglycan hydrolase-like protein with peptidoglycan-binding domain
VNGQPEELLWRGDRTGPLQTASGDYFVSKDFVLRVGDSRDVDVPAPAAGYIDGLDPRTGTMQIWSGPPDDPNREMIAQVRHMDPASFEHRQAGDRIEYGETMGTQSGRGSKDGVVSNSAYPTHVHIDINTRYLGQLDRYLQDLDSGAITTDQRPAPSENVVGPAAVVTNVRDHLGQPVGPVDPLADGILANGDKGDAVGVLQSQLNALGYTNRRGEPLVVDNDFGPGTEHALKQFQTDRGLPATGTADEATRTAVEAATREREQGTPERRTDLQGAPSDPLMDSMRTHVHAMDRSMGRMPDEASDRVAASLTAEWRAAGLTAPVGGVVLGQKGTKAEAGEYVFAYSGSPERPNDFVGVKTAEAVRTPVELSLARADTLLNQQAIDAQQPTISTPARAMV